MNIYACLCMFIDIQYSCIKTFFIGIDILALDILIRDMIQ